MKRITGILAFVLILLSVHQAEAGLGTSADSLRVKWMDGKKYILHKVDVKETWSLLSRRYQVSIEEIKAANSGITDLKVGQIIHIPVVARTESTQPAPASPTVVPVVQQPVYYTVKHGETLYSVSKRFGKTVDEMRTMNRLETDQLREGQQLVVRYIEKSATTGTAVTQTPNNPAETSPVNRTAEPPSATRTSPSASLPATTAVVPASAFEKPTKTVEPIRKASGGKTLVQVTETGVASWVPDGEVNQDKYYGLHRSAPIGTIIKVTNRMNNQSVYVKIVGVLPDTGDNENVIIKVSQAVANKLNALDPLFRAELSYGLMQ